MRWHVEVTPIGKTDTQSAVLEAESWQRALQAMRAMRGDDSPMSGFSIELLDTGYRAVDPMRRLVYVVTHAENAPLSGGKVAAAEAGATAKGDAAEMDTQPMRVGDIAALAAEAAKATKPPASVRPLPPRPHSVAPSAPHAGAESAKTLVKETTASGASTAERPGASAKPDAAPAEDPGASAKPDAAPAETFEATLADPPAPPPPVAPREDAVTGREPERDARLVLATDDDAATYIDRRLPGADPAPSPADVPPTQVIFKREEDPSASAPLTYREYVYAVTAGTSEEDAERVLLAQFELVKRALEGARRGKLVNLAVYDSIFRGRPTVVPVATLAWKDWKGPAPVIEFPRRRAARSAASVSPSPPSAPPPAVVPAPVVAAPAAPAPVVPAPALTLAVEPIPVPAAPEPEAAALPAPERLTDSTAGAVLSQSAPLTPAPAPGPGPTDRPSNAGRISRPGGAGGRAKGDELITALFEAMHDLHFLRDAIEGGDFCLSLAIETLPAAGGIVHLYDIDKREFVVTCTAGKGVERLLSTRSPESDALLLAAMRKRRALVVGDAASHDGAATTRYAPFGGAKHLMVAPVLYGGRFIGAIELVNTTDGSPFTEDEGNALSYIAEQYAEYVTQRGIILDADRISQRSGSARAR
jgi:hypothetical protein